MALNFWYAVRRPGGPRLGRSVSIPKYSKSRSLSAFESFEGPAASSESPASEEAEETRDPDVTDKERGTDPEQEPKEIE